jgi:hypothetical protein
MIRLLLVLALASFGLAHGGELAQLHRELAAAASGPTAATPPGRTTAASPGITQVQPLPLRAPMPAIQRLGYEALPCRGSCRAFTVIFYADGSFTYEGNSNVPRLGSGSGTVPTFMLQQIMRYVSDVGFTELDDTYASSMLDVNTTYTMVDLGSSVKVIQNQGNSAPATVWALEQLLNDLLAMATWD